MGWHKGKSYSLNKAQRQRHSSPNLYSTATPATKTEGQTKNEKLSLLFVGSITYLKIIMLLPTKSFLLNIPVLHKFTRLKMLSSTLLIFKTINSEVNEKDN